jgi:pyridoxine 4-dehydrogenase
MASPDAKVMLPTPGTGSVAHLEENAAGAAVKLSDVDFTKRDAASKR